MIGDYGPRALLHFGSCQYRRNVIDQVVSTALPESTNADEAYYLGGEGCIGHFTNYFDQEEAQTCIPAYERLHCSMGCLSDCTCIHAGCDEETLNYHSSEFELSDIKDSY